MTAQAVPSAETQGDLDLDLDISIVETTSEVNVLLGDTDDGCNTVAGSDC